MYPSRLSMFVIRSLSNATPSGSLPCRKFELQTSSTPSPGNLKGRVLPARVSDRIPQPRRPPNPRTPPSPSPINPFVNPEKPSQVRPQPATFSTPFWNKTTPSGCPFPVIDASPGPAADPEKAEARGPCLLPQPCPEALGIPKMTSNLYPVRPVSLFKRNSAQYLIQAVL